MQCAFTQQPLDQDTMRLVGDFHTAAWPRNDILPAPVVHQSSLLRTLPKPTPIRQSTRNLEVFDQWCLQHTLRISWTARISNEEVHWCTDQPPLTSSVPPALSSLLTLHVPINLWTTVKPFGQCGSFAKWLESPIGLTASHLALDHWIRFSTAQHWSGNRLSLSTESSSLQHARRNSNVQHRTSHTLMMMMIE